MTAFRAFLPALLALTAVAMLACGRGETGGRVLVLALDGLDPATVDTLIAEGGLPHFRRLRGEGAAGRLESREPLLSPIIWTTVATGRTPDAHGIGDFVAVNQATGETLPATSEMRRVPALWNILGEGGRTVSVVGWWATWPAEEVRGQIVSDHLCYHFLFGKGLAGESSDLALTYPPGLQEQIADLVRRPGDITPDMAARFVDVPAADFDRPFSYDDELGHFRWVLATAATYRDIGLRLWRQEHPDLAMVYIEGVDSTSHLFGHLFRAEGLAGDLAAQQRRYGRAVEEMYSYADEILGQYMAAMDPETTLVVLSDHGFRLGTLPVDPSQMEDMRRVRANQHRLHGYLGLMGRGVRPGSGPDNATILDIAPTILALAGLPASRDMPGRVLIEALDVEVPARIESYDPLGPQGSATRADAEVDEQILQRLRSLGYLDTTAPRGDKVLAGVLFEEGKLEEALAEYRRLLAADPDDGALHSSIAGVLGRLGRFGEAEAHLDRALEITPLNASAWHNRGVIRERRGDPGGAVEAYRTATRYRPDYQPARDALVRLTGSAELPVPDDPDTRRADALAQQASLLARGGDYEAAMDLLDQAMAVAPDYGLLYQYRANVAYLMGDREAARAALERGLELEPDNALFRENLKRLEGAEPSGSPAAPEPR